MQLQLAVAEWSEWLFLGSHDSDPIEGHQTLIHLKSGKASLLARDQLHDSV